MADVQDTTVSTAATIVSAPAAATPAPVVSAPATPTTPSDSSAPAAVVTPAATVAETIVTSEPAKVETPTPATTESVLGDVKPTEAAKPGESEKVPEADKTKVIPAEEPKVELPTYEAFKTPENVTLDKEPLDAFTKILGEIEIGKLDHLGMQAKGQALIDLAAKATIDSINRLNDSYVQTHEASKKARLTALKADTEMGGEKFSDTVVLLQKTINEFGGTQSQIAEFRKEVTDSGLDASPAVCRLIYNMQQKINEYTTEGDANRIVPGAKPAPSKVKPYQMFYQGNS